MAHRAAVSLDSSCVTTTDHGRFSQFETKTASIVDIVACKSSTAVNAHIDFTFEHQEGRRHMHGTAATGQV